MDLLGALDPAGVTFVVVVGLFTLAFGRRIRKLLEWAPLNEPPEATKFDSYVEKWSR